MTRRKRRKFPSTTTENGILDEGILTLEELCALIGQARQSEAELIMTGTVYPAALDEWVDEVTKLQTRFE